VSNETAEQSMTALEACDRIEEAISALHEETRNSEWIWGSTKPQSDEGHISDFTETLAKTRSHFAVEGDTSRWMLFSESDAILCDCGNLPTAEQRSRYLSYVSPRNIALLISRVRQLELQLENTTNAG